MDQFSWKQFYGMPVVGIFRRLPFAAFKEILPRYVEAGLNTLEITVDSPDFLKCIEYANDNFSQHINIGAGTVLDPEYFEMAKNAGAQFIVTPHVDEAIIQKAQDAKLPIFAGAFTPSEIVKAWKLGASLVKLFPAKNLGPAYLHELLNGPLPHIAFLPTGGISLQNMEEFAMKGVHGFGLSGCLFDKKAIQSRNWQVLENQFRLIVTTMEKITKKLHGYKTTPGITLTKSK